MFQLWRKGVAGVVTAASLAAMVMASSAPAEAAWRGPYGGFHGGGYRGGAVAAGIIGGLALGALAGAATRSYAAPVYADPVYPAAAYPVAPAYAEPVYQGGYAYQSGCYKEWRPVYGADGNYIRDRKVTVCY